MGRNPSQEFPGDWAELASLLARAQMAFDEAARRGESPDRLAALRRRVLGATRRAGQDPAAAVTAVTSVIEELG